MNNLGWNDGIEAPIRVAYRQKGERREVNFRGPVYITGADEKLAHVPRAELPLVDGLLDLTKVPAIAIGGKRKHQPARVRQFLAENVGFQGAFLLWPGSGNWDLGEGMIFVTSREILAGRRVSGGRPEEQLTNFRWLRDGRYVADRATLLHGKVLKTIAAELEQPVDASLLAQALLARRFLHRLSDTIESVVSELRELEARRTLLTNEQSRDVVVLTRAKLVEKFAGIRFVRDIPETLTITAEEIAPELTSACDTLGTVLVPGVGRKLPQRQYGNYGFGSSFLTVSLTTEELRALEAWPFDAIYPVFSGLDMFSQLSYQLREAVEAPEAERLAKLRTLFAERWLDSLRSANYPKTQKVSDPREADPPATPAPVVWGHDLFTGEPKTVYAALYHGVSENRGRIVDSGWSIRWFDDAREAAETDAKARREAESYITARRLEAELTANAQTAELPCPLPAPYTAPTPQLANVMERLGFPPEQFRIEGEGPVRVCLQEESGYHSDRTERYVVLSHAVWGDRWWRKDGKVIVVFANATVTHLLCDSYTQSIARGIGVAPETIQAVKAELDHERQQAEERYRATVREFIQTLQAQPAYASLSSEMRAKLEALLNSRELPNLQGLADELRREWSNAEALHTHTQRGDVLTNWGGDFRIMGATRNQEYWVVRPDGSLRDPDEISYRKRYLSEGNKHWRLVAPEELALTWAKAYTAADHEFVIAKRPTNGCTPAQLETVQRLESEIAERFDGATGMSGKSSPSIGAGWGLVPTPSAPPALATPASLDALKAKFGGGRR